MKRVLTVLFFAAFAFTGTLLFAAESRLGLGVVLGDPSGITGKVFISSSDAIDAGIGASHHHGAYVYGDYLRHFSGVFPVPSLLLYLGIGPGFYDHDSEGRNHSESDENGLECRFPIGLEYRFTTIPLAAFLELVPAMEIVPDIDFHLRGGLGIRYFIW
jgi:hypothetical protein